MKHWRQTLGVAFAVVALALCATRPSAAQAVTDLGLGNGYDHSAVMAINNSGMAVGAVINGDMYSMTGSRAAVWTPGTVAPVVLPLLKGYTDSVAMYVNDSGLVVGVCATGDIQQPQTCAWNIVKGRWVVRGLGLLPGTLNGMTMPLGVNAKGQVIGRSADADTGETGCFIWDAVNGMRPFTNLSDGEYGASVTIDVSEYRGLSDNGLVVGTALTANRLDNGAIIWDSATGLEVLHLQDGEALAISPSGKQVAGYQPINETKGMKRNLVLWTWDDLQEKFVMNDLGHPALRLPSEGETMSGWIVVPTAMTDDGRIIGEATAYFDTDGDGDWEYPTYTTYWSYSDGAYTDLAAVLPTSESAGIVRPLMSANGLVAINMEKEAAGIYRWDGEGTAQLLPDLGYGGATAFGLNDDGLIVGYAPVTTDSLTQMHGVLWSPSGVSALEFSAPTVSVKGKTLTLTLKIAASNPNSVSATDAQLTAATLNEAATTTLLPLAIGTVKAGSSKTISLTFDSLESGQEVELKISGTCSLGSFFTTQTVIIP